MKGGRDDIKAGFAKVKDLPTPLGKFSFLAEPRRQPRRRRVQVVKDGKFQIAPVAAGAGRERGAADHQRAVPGEHLRAVRARLHARLRRARHPEPGPRRRSSCWPPSWRWRSSGRAPPHPAWRCRSRSLFAGLLGLVLERVAFRPLRGRTDSNISGLISSLALATIFEAVALEIWGPNISRFPFGTLPETAAIQLLGGAVSPAAAHHHRRGGGAVPRPHLAGAADAARAARSGPWRRARGRRASWASNVDRVIAASFFISSALGGAAGVLFGLAFNSISPGHGARASS